MPRAHFRGVLSLRIGSDVYTKASLELYKRQSDGAFLGPSAMAKIADAHEVHSDTVAGGWFGTLSADLIFVRESGEQIVADAGTRTDGSSIPEALRSIVPRLGSAMDKASILHDFLYQYPDGRDRVECDQIFMEAMESQRRLSAFLRVMAYHAARRFGDAPWRKRWGEVGI